MVKVTYLYHSGFAVELNRYVLVFDYCTPEGCGESCVARRMAAVPEGKQLVVFVSHKHPDHFRMETLKWAEEISKNTRYFVGNDIRLNEKYLERKGICPDILERMERMRGGAVYEDGEKDFRVEALRSTDQGVAFLVFAQGVSIYHAGDLNYWYWKEEPESWNRKMERDYQKEIEKIAEKHFDIAFLPLDPRLGEGYCYGMDLFLQKVAVEHVFPMHMWEKYDIVGRYKRSGIGMRFAGKIRDVSEDNREFLLQTY